jgi:hypothetical protein
LTTPNSNNKLVRSTCKQQHKYIQIPFLLFFPLSLSPLSLICVDNFHRTSLYCKRARSIKETYAAIVKANIYFFLTSLSLHTRAFARLLPEELGRWRCIGSGRRGGEKVGVVSFFFKSMRIHTHTSLATIVALVIEKKKKNNRERKLGKEI